MTEEPFDAFEARLHREQDERRRASKKEPNQGGGRTGPVPRNYIKRSGVTWYRLFAPHPPLVGPEAPTRIEVAPAATEIRREKPAKRTYTAKQRERLRRRREKREAKDCRTVPGVELLRLDPCSYCGDPHPTNHDHIEPIFRGGKHELDNLTRACWNCNKEKATTPLLLFLAKRASRQRFRVSAR